MELKKEEELYAMKIILMLHFSIIQVCFFIRNTAKYGGDFMAYVNSAVSFDDFSTTTFSY